MTSMLALMSRAMRREPWWAEFWSAATISLWAGIAYVGMADLNDWPAMRVLAELGDGRSWHLLGFGLGFCQMVALAAHWPWLRGSLAMAAAWFWGVLALGVWLAAPWSPVAAAHAGWCAVNLFSVLRTMPPARRPRRLAA